MVPQPADRRQLAVAHQLRVRRANFVEPARSGARFDAGTVIPNFVPGVSVSSILPALSSARRMNVTNNSFFLRIAG